MENQNIHSNQNLFRPLAGLALTTGLILLIPLIAMQFTNEVMWTLSDFIFAGVLLFATGLSYILITRVLASNSGGNTMYKISVGFALFTGLFLIWSNLAVGIIGSENNAFNLIYFSIIAIGVIGALIVRFSPRGMMWVMFTLAIAQTAIALAALVMGMQHIPESSVFEIMGVNGFFVVLFIVSGLLFRNSENEI